MNPLKVKASGSPITSANISGLQTMTDAEVKNYIANVITEKFAAVTNGTGTAELNVTTDDSGSGTSIGTFVDTNRTEAIGTHPATGATTSTTYYAKQVTAAATENITNRPLAWDSHLEEMTDGDIDGVMDLCIEAMVTESNYTAGQYKLQSSAPSGGTWVSRYTITDTAQGGNTTTYLWQKTVASSTPNSDYTPLKVYNGSNCKQMVESEIEQLLPNFRNRIIETGKGTYKLQSTAPTSGGTWVEMGASFSDTREQITPQSYVGNYTGTFLNNFAGNYTGPANYTGNYSGGGNFAGYYTGVGNYAGLPYAGPPIPGPAYTTVNIQYYTGYYTGPSGASYTGTYVGFYAGGGIPYAGPPVPAPPYAGPPYASPPSPGVTYTGYYAGVIPGSPTPTPFTGYYAGPSTPGGNYTGFFAGTDTFVGFYGGGVEPGTFQYFTGYFAGVIPGGVPYAGSYAGPPTPQTFTGYYQGPPLAPGEPGDSFTGFYNGVGPSWYTGFYTGGPTPANFAGYFLGPAPAGPSYSGFYTGPAFYQGYFAGAPTPGPTYTGYYIGVVPGAPTPANFTGYYTGPATPGGNYTAFYSGPPVAINYTGPGGNYTGYYTGYYSPGLQAYSGSYASAFTNFYSTLTPGINYTGYYSGPATYTGYYSGPGGNYTGFYSGTATYTGTYSGSFINTFAGNYSGATIQASKDTVSTVKLWIRTN